MTNSAPSTQPEPILWALPQYALAQTLTQGMAHSLALGLFVPGILMAQRPKPEPAPETRP